MQSFTPDGISPLLHYLSRQDAAMLLDNTFNREGRFDYLCGCGVKEAVTEWDEKAIQAILKKASAEKKYVFIHLTYPLKNRFENLSSRYADAFQWPEVHFFIPETVIRIKDDTCEIFSENKNADKRWQEVQNASPFNFHHSIDEIKAGLSRVEYIYQTGKLLEHIHRGDIYEVNFCFEMKGAGQLNPVSTFLKMKKDFPSPFAAFYKLNNNYLLCSSPERFIRREGDKIISQPIKGTAARGRTSEEDEVMASALRNNEKEIAENVMIVDLVRNDIGRIAKTGSIQVDELCGLYTFPAVHQLISTVSGNIREGINFTGIIRALFPMGSMTGAPKISAMKLIDRYENFNRGLYSGSIGYIDPNGNFDFNVVIRSILYNSQSGFISIPAGSALTAASEPDAEYQECLLKSRALLSSLS